MAIRRILRVYPNPYHGLPDVEGRPCCVLPAEPVGDGINTFDDNRKIGASLKATLLQKFPQGDARGSSVSDHEWIYQDEPVEVLFSPYYVMALRQGALVAADEKSAKMAGIPFVDPGTYLEDAKKGQIEHMLTVHVHDDIDPDELKDQLGKHSFGPMPSAKKARDVKASADKKAEDDAAKVEAAKKKPAPSAQGGDK